MNISKEDYLKYYSDDSALDRFKEHGISGVNSSDIAGVAGYANGFINWGDRANRVFGTPAFSKIPLAGVAISAWGEGAAGQQRLDRIAYWFADGNTRQLQYDPTYRDTIRRAEEAGYEGGKEAFVTLAGSGVGASLAGLITMNPIVAILGAMAGGGVANKTYSAAFKQEVQDPITIAMQVAKMHEMEGHVDHVAVFSALAANLKGEQAAHVDRILERYTGTKYFAEALSDPNNIPKIEAMMNNPVIDSYIRAQTGMTIDPNNPNKPVAIQYAELINGGYMKANKILEVGSGMYAQMQQNIVNQPASTMNITAPSVPYAGQVNQHSIVG